MRPSLAPIDNQHASLVRSNSYGVSGLLTVVAPVRVVEPILEANQVSAPAGVLGEHRR
jgi:hypothetical protein